MIPSPGNIDAVILALKEREGEIYVLVSHNVDSWQVDQTHYPTPLYSTHDMGRPFAYMSGHMSWRFTIEGWGEMVWMTLDEFQARYGNWRDAMRKEPLALPPTNPKAMSSATAKLLPRGPNDG